MTQLGFGRPREAAEDYLRNYLTLDKEFVPFAKKAASKYEMVLLSNDVLEWSEYITEIYGLNGFFAEKFGITPVLFNRDGEEYDKSVVNNYGELAKILGI